MLTYFSSILLIFLYFIRNGNTLQCFVCNSAYDVNCDSKSPPLQYLVNCSHLTAIPVVHDGVRISFEDKINHNFNRSEVDNLNNQTFYTMDTNVEQSMSYTFCRKQDVTISEQNNLVHIKPETRRIVRSCGWLGTPNKDVCKLISREVIISQHCSCLEDACNKVGQLKNNANFVIAYFIGAIFMLF